MRRFTLLTLVALFVATVGMAQNGSKRLTELKTQTSTQALQRSIKPSLGEVLQSQKSTWTMKGLQRPEALPTTLRAPYKAAVITNQPEGEYMLMSRSGEAYGASLFGVFYAEVSGKVAEVVFGADNKVYMKDIITQFNTGGWIEGTLSGSTITFKLPQPIYEESGSTYYATMMKFSNNTFVKDNTSQQLTFNYNKKEGIITSASNLADGSRVIGLATADGAWTGFADWNITMNTVTEQPAEAPEGLETTDYAITAPDVVGSIVQVGFKDNEVWVKGIYAGMPDAWIHGTINGNKATFPKGQFLGADLTTGYFQYLMSAKIEEVYYEEYGETYTSYILDNADITFDYDPLTREFTNSSCFLINAGTDAVSYAAAFNEASLKPFAEVAATPQTPVWNGISEYGFDYFYNYQYGWGVFDFDILTEDTDGNFILPEKLTYLIYTRVNGEEKVYEFSAYDHIYQTVPTMTEIPFDYADGWDFAVSGTQHTIYFFNGGAEAYGIQAIYRGAGEEHRSEIAWYDMPTLFTDIQPEAATPEYPDIDPANQGSSITLSPYTGNENRTTFGNWTPQTYDVAIHLQDDAITGSHIDEITFQVKKTSGTSGYKVWLSSQLRVENNVNVPDLVCIDVTPTKTGSCTVTLPKPYLIPAEGVYVGYSVTIDKASSTDGGPVTVIDQVKESGMYIHMSRNLLKWEDLSQDAGMSAVIDVTVSGANIVDNAAAPVAGNNVYAKVGDEITVTQEFVNHGAAGIKSMDVEYKLDGKTYTKTITSKVKGQFGLNTYASFTLPAISEAGTYDFTMRVVKVNGQDNMDQAPEAVTPIQVLNTVPKKRTLMEEYTGTWCGWCTRGFVALELLKKSYADDFVTVSYHNDDPMEIMPSAYFPSPVSGFPGAWIDRGMSVDPYGGEPYDDSHFSTLDILQWRNAMFANAEIDLKAELNEAEDEVNVTANVTFPYSDDNANFALEYVLVEDGLTGAAGTDWDQQNYYSGETSVSADLKEMASKGSTISGLVFNDVAVGISQIGGIAESIPQSVKADVPVEHTYTFYPDYCYNTAYEPIIQDKSQLYVVAMLIDLSEGIVVNAVKVKVEPANAVGIHSVTSVPSESSVFYNLQGQRLSKAQKGVNIVGGRKVIVRK
ncbi:MAG: hypothetical protein IJ887_05290 [Prevotella sp.]|nr:hypothetical protein [Prevotella sp.]